MACYLTMFNLIKAQATPQINCYTHWTSLGANGVQDKLIEEGPKHPDQIKISFEKGPKDITGHVMPNQAQFEPKYFLPFMHLDLKSTILTRLSEAKQEDNPTLFNLMGQCFQDIGLTK